VNDSTRHECDGLGKQADPDDAWVRLVMGRHAPSVGAWLRSRYSILTAEDVEDVVVIASVRLWAVRERFDAEKGSLRSWFARIADNVARRLIESGWARTRRLEVPLDELQHPATSDNRIFDEPAEETRQASQVRQALDRLPEAYRTILLADAYATGRVASAELLSQELQIPVATVRVYRHRAVKAIRRLLTERGKEVP
jgi:RNA polymerase sigma factor (sigma-70 family)